MSSNIGGHTKKTTMNALVVTCAYVGAIAGPFTFKGEESHEGYPTGISTVLGMLVLVMVSFLFLG